MNSILEDLYDNNLGVSEPSEPPKKCPLMVAYDEIRSGGWYNDLIDEELEAESVFVGGDDCYIPDNITYVMNMRGVIIARMKLHGKSPAEICNKMYSIYKDKNETQIFNVLLSQSSMYTHAVEQFMKLMALVANINAYVQKKISEDDNFALDLSLPDILLPQDAPENIMQSNEVLKTIFNRIIEFISKLDLRPLGIDRADIPPFMDEPVEITHGDMVIIFGPNASEEDLQKLRNTELNIAKKVIEYEKYQCKIINHVNKIFHVISEELKN